MQKIVQKSQSNLIKPTNISKMKFLDLLFSKNKRKWISFLDDVATPMDRFGVSKWRLIVDNFCLKYNMDFEKFLANRNWDKRKLSIYHDKNEIFQCSNSFRIYYAENSERILSNANLGENQWFYHIFPDVAKYFEENYEEIEIFCNSVGYNYSIYDSKYNLHVFEFVIEQYIKLHDRLECSLK